MVEGGLTQSAGVSHPTNDDPTSPWAERFRQGATIVPRFLFFVERQAAGPLGLSAGNASVRSLQRANDKKPWKDLPALEGVVETEFLRPALLGESVLPFRIATIFEAVIPRDRDGLMDGQSDRLDAHEGLASWWRRAEEIWDRHRSSERMTLIERLDFQHTLEHQFPMQAPGGSASRIRPDVGPNGGAVTFLCVVVAWVFFRAGSFLAAGNILRGMAGGFGLRHANAAVRGLDDWARSCRSPPGWPSYGSCRIPRSSWAAPGEPDNRREGWRVLPGRRPAG